MLSDFITYRKIEGSLNIDSSSPLCNICYQALHRFSKCKEYQESLRNDKDTLAVLLAPFTNVDVQTFDDVETFAFSTAMEYLGNELLNDHAVLPQTVFTKYSQAFDEKSQVFPSGIDHPKKNIFQFSTLLHSAIGDCIVLSHIDKERRLGTMIRRCGMDVISSLHRLLFYSGKEKDILESEINRLKEQYSAPKESHGKLINLAQASNTLNDCLQVTSQEIVRKRKEHAVGSDNYSDFDIVSEIEKLPPRLWNFVLHVTLNEEEQKQFLIRDDFSWDHHCLMQFHSSKRVHHKRQLRRFFCVRHSYTLLMRTVSQIFTLSCLM